jgi:RNA polymerase sigma-70 factor (ECF subfamily)
LSTTEALGPPLTEATPPEAARPDEDRSPRPDREAPPTSADEPRTGQQATDTWAYVDAAQNGDPDAFARLYDEYAQVVYRYVLFRISDHSLAEDITSETFLRALRRIASVTYQGRDVAAWFITIAKNLVLDHVKSSRHRLEVPTHDLAHTWSAQRSQQVGPEQHVLTTAAHLELVRCVRALNPEQRECIRLRFGQGLSVTETAARMDRNEGAVKALQHRAVRRLAQLLQDDPR